MKLKLAGGVAVLFAMNIFAAELPQKIELAGASMVLVPAGQFTMGSDKVDKENRDQEFGSIKPFYLDEHPQHKVENAAYYLDQYEVTNGQYREFVQSAHYQPPAHWLEDGFLVSLKRDRLKELSVVKLRNVVVDVFQLDVDARNMSKPELLAAVDRHFAQEDKVPVHNVNWFDAQAYCKWAGKRLPTEAEWEESARGRDGREFPWGNDWHAGMANTGDEEWPFGVAPGGSYTSDKSSFEVYDLAGNVSEWVADWYDAYSNSDYSNERFGKQYKVIRGAGWGGSGHYALEMYQRAAYRLYMSPDADHEDLGFRCAADATDTVVLSAALSH